MPASRDNMAQMCCKGIFHTFNAIVWVTSLLLGGYIGFVLGMKSDTPTLSAVDDTEGWNELGEFFQKEVFIAILLAVAVLIFILGLCGCCGVGAESFCLIKSYIIFMMLIVLAELTALIFMVVKDGTVGEVLGIVWWQLDKYSRTFVHHAFDCCGFASLTNYSVQAEANFNNCMSPEVVTVSPDGATTPPALPDCLQAFKKWGKDNVHIWVSVFVALVASQAAAIFSSCAVYSAAYKKMELRSNVENEKLKTLKNKTTSPPKNNGQALRGKRKVGALAATNKRQKEGKSPSTISSGSETRETSYGRVLPSKEQIAKERSRDQHPGQLPPPLPPDHPHHRDEAFATHGPINGHYNSGYYDQGYW